MPNEIRPSFAFLVLTYNHQDYILEHLESIKYLVLTYGASIEVDLIVNDDCSKDQTRKLVDSWLNINTNIFRYVTTLYSTKNLGTCTSVNNMLTNVVADRCKLTAGDDVYSFENIFELTKYDSNVAMVSGRALYLLGNTLSRNIRSDLLTTATQIIYKNNSLLHRFKHLSYNNAPNLLYATECLLNPEVRTYLLRFDVTEDWPLQLAIARKFQEYRFKLIDEILVYYRRSSGSTYIIENERFAKDKINIYDDLIKNESIPIERLRLNSRLFCFKFRNHWINKLINLDIYFFAFSCACNVLLILKQLMILKIPVAKHKDHYAYIQKKAMESRNSIIFND